LRMAQRRKIVFKHLLAQKSHRARTLTRLTEFTFHAMSER
jgi:hypothetical protein